jgi:predicted metal-dependent hydrolase
MVTQITLGEIVADVVKKDIKNVHLSVYPPVGTVRISAPLRMDNDTIRVFALSKLGWIKQQQQKLRAQERETPREYLDRESHYVWGKRYLLRLIEMDAAPEVMLLHHEIQIRVRPAASPEKRQEILEAWYRETLKAAVPPLIAKWEPIVGVTVARFFVQRMKTKWGSCSPHTRHIRLNTELAKKPPECLEYIVVHEMVHLLEPTHNRRFIALMDHFMPRWQFYRSEINNLPIRHETWRY